MIIGREKSAPVQQVEGPNRRQLKVLLSPLLNDGLYELAAGMTVIGKGSSSESHEHMEGELFYVLSGHGEIIDGEETEALDPGTAVFSPAFNKHQMINNSEEELKVLWVLVPPGREKYILEKAD